MIARLELAGSSRVGDRCRPPVGRRHVYDLIAWAHVTALIVLGLVTRHSSSTARSTWYRESVFASVAGLGELGRRLRAGWSLRL